MQKSIHLWEVDDRFWNGFGLSDCPSFENMSVLDLGCGAGNRCFEAAAHDAARVVGVDTSDAHFPPGRNFLPSTTASLHDRVTFFKGTLVSLPPEQFDVILSENTFEHVMNVSTLLAEVKERLKPGGRFYVGFGPLYHSYDGDHGWLRDTLPGAKCFLWPWGHLLFERYAFRQLGKKFGRTIDKTYDWPYLDLNQHKVSEFEAMFHNSGMQVAYFRTNRVRSLKAKLFTSLSAFRVLEPYFTFNIFAILVAR